MDLQMEEMQLASLLEQYDNVEKEMHSLSSELSVSKKKRRQLHAEVEFLQRKVTSFRETANGPKNNRHAVASAERKKPKPKRKEEPKFYDVQIQFQPALMNRGMLPYSSRMADYRTNYIPHSDYRWGQGTSYLGNAEVM